ncbi:MAG: hypothetical protein HRU19_13325 [Pseudobacteriovorax sp.]|nr:hypothetical protein [Pseudobacteriovorax sp.]
MNVMIRTILFSFAILLSNFAYASPDATTIFCQKYPNSGLCEDQAASCNVCHAGPPSLNDYGLSIKENIGGDLITNLPDALGKIEAIDSDGDGASNLTEIEENAHPGNADVKPGKDITVEYDRKMAFKRMKANYCGESATYQELKGLEAAADPKDYMHKALDVCLASDYWVKEALHRLADNKIMPNAAIGFGGSVVIGDYRFDYRLFSYIMSGGRDARELLSADYHVDENYNKIEGTVAREEGLQLGERIVIAGGQPLEVGRRVGMITTQWFLSNNTMFADLPRNSASQAYRAYLGLDLAKGEGLMPVPNEPRDVDNIDIAKPECAVCHSTLDPLAYSFASYRGIEIGVFDLLLNRIGTYNEGRTDWGGDGVIFGQPVQDLMEWASVARESDAFKKNLANMIFTQALSRKPFPHETAEFDALWQGLAAENYSVNAMIHRFVEMGSFGGKIK